MLGITSIEHVSNEEILIKMVTKETVILKIRKGQKKSSGGLMEQKAW